MKLLKRIKNNLDVPFYVKTKLNYIKDCKDIFGDFQFYLKISKCYTLKGMRWRIEVPNRTDHDSDLYKLLSRTFQYIHDKGCRYTRLEDGIDNIDNLWNMLENKVAKKVKVKVDMDLENKKFKPIKLEDAHTGETKIVEAKLAMLPISMIADLMYINKYDLMKEIIDILESSKYIITIPIIDKENTVNNSSEPLPVTEEYIYLDLESDSKQLYGCMETYMRGLSDPRSGIKTYDTMTRFLDCSLKNEIFKIETKEYIYDVILYSMYFRPDEKHKYQFKIINRCPNSLYWIANNGGN